MMTSATPVLSAMGSRDLEPAGPALPGARHEKPMLPAGPPGTTRTLGRDAGDQGPQMIRIEKRRG